MVQTKEMAAFLLPIVNLDPNEAVGLNSVGIA
jgi:hypothetical protein